MAEDLVIKISGDIKNYEQALEEVKGKTESLTSSLENTAKIAGLVFATLTAEIGFSVKAFGESQQASNSLTQALQNQGIYSNKLAESYKAQAAKLQDLTGVDDDAIIKAQALLQGHIGQQQITMSLTKAIVDLSAAKHMDLDSTTELIGKGIQGHTMALQKLGIHIDEHLDKEQRTAKIIEIVETKFGDQAKAANQGLGSIKGLTSAFSDFQENIGQRFAPFIEKAIAALTNFFKEINQHKEVADLAFSLIAAGAAVSGVVLAVTAGGLAFLKLKAALEAAEIATSAMSLATKTLVGATGIGLLVLIATEIYLNWSTIWPRMQAIYQAFVSNIGTLSGGLGMVLEGIFKLNPTKIKEGLDIAKNAVLKSYDEMTKALPKDTLIEGPKITQDSNKLALAKEQNQREIDEEQRKNAVLDGEQELMLMKIGDTSAEIIQIKTDELNTLKAIQEEKNAGIRDELTAHLAEVQNITTQKQAEAYIRDQADKKRYLVDQQKFGTAFAEINEVMHSHSVDSAKAAGTELSQLQNSGNATLKGIGKAAAITNMIISTIEGATRAFTALAWIPFVGVPLGIAAAAAISAYGAERIGSIAAMESGGIVTGGIPGVDSVPAMLMPGELVVPTKDFDSVVNAVSSQRNGDIGGSPGGEAHIIVTLKDDLMDFIEMKLVERTRLNLSIQGA